MPFFTINACTGRGLFRVGVTFEIHVSQTVMNLVILIREDEEFSSARSINTMDIKSLHFTFNIFSNFTHNLAISWPTVSFQHSGAYFFYASEDLSSDWV